MGDQEKAKTGTVDPLERAYGAWGKGDYGAAVRELNQILARQPYASEAFEMKIDVLRHANLNLYYAGVIEKRYLAKQGTYRGISNSNRRLGKWNRIDAEFDRLQRDLRQNPDSVYRAAILNFSDNALTTDASNIDLIDVAEMSEALGTRNASLVKGVVEVRLGHLDAAIEALESAVRASPPSHEGFSILSRVHRAGGNRRRAAALAHLALISANHVWYTTGAINGATLENIQADYGKFNRLQTDAEGLRYSGLPRFLSAVEDLPRTPIRLPLRFKHIVKMFVPIRFLLWAERVVNTTPAGRWIRERRYS